MHWLNYHHLYYFWTVAREKSIAKACQRLLLTQPTISAQIRELENSLGQKLFNRVGRNLVLTEAGREAYRYANEIFTLGRELQDALRGSATGRTPRLVIGIHDAMPKLISSQILMPALKMPEPVQLVCHEGPVELLLSRMALYELDGILSDSPAPPSVNVRSFNHLLGECGVSFFAAAPLATKYRRNFPESLRGAPFLLPLADTSLRRSLERWLDDAGLRVDMRGEFADSALLKAFGESGAGIFPAPTVIEREVCRQFRVRVVGRVEEIRERYFLIASERKLKHPAVAAITEMARNTLFAGASGRPAPIK